MTVRGQQPSRLVAGLWIEVIETSGRGGRTPGDRRWGWTEHGSRWRRRGLKTLRLYPLGARCGRPLFKCRRRFDRIGQGPGGLHALPLDARLGRLSHAALQPRATRAELPP